MTTANFAQPIVVLGTGTMAVGIASGFIEAGMPLVLLGRSIEKAQSTLSQAQELAKNSGYQGSSNLSHEVGLIDTWNNWNSVAWVIETVTENFEIKRALFQDLDLRVPAHIPIGTNSSGFPKIGRAHV